ncbi:protein 5NUC-like [Microplitis mediator]|uniref:protein 5NUC-like n=1 Tax=Microplitis mediator TaxID=375433 RepID=UPI00255603DF|nr:protein 5NUC-like [Microplitis mediator]
MNLSTITSVLLIIFSIHLTIGQGYKSRRIHRRGRTRQASNNGDWRLNIIHTNDMHSRFDEISASATPCSDKQKEKNECYGGFARISTLVQRARKSSTPTLFLNAGDTYFGSTWFIHYGWEIVAKFLNILKPDAISLGNHEFDLAPEGLIPFINNATFPVVTCNLDLTKQQDLAVPNLKNFTIIEKNGRKIGIIGFLTKETEVISSVGRVVILDEIESIRDQVKILKQKGVNIIIALGHSGYERDKEIAKAVDDLDLVIGGHTNTFLYNGTAPDQEVPEGLYPTTVVQKNGRKVYVVQAFAYTKYLGNLSIVFDSEGEIKQIEGNPILVNHEIEKDQNIVEQLNGMKQPIDDLMNKTVGQTKVKLEGGKIPCRVRECNLGNLITDSMVQHNAGQYGGDDGWTDAAVAIYNSGAIKTSIDKSHDITKNDIYNVLAHYNVIGKISMTGKLLLDVLEFSVASLKPDPGPDPSGRFLQVSGLKIVYDLLQPAGSKVVRDSTLIRCADCDVPKYEKIIEDKIYKIITVDFLHTGGDGFEMLKNLPWQSDISAETTRYALGIYIEKNSIVFPSIEDRIKFINEQKTDDFTTDGDTYSIDIDLDILND